MIMDVVSALYLKTAKERIDTLKAGKAFYTKQSLLNSFDTAKRNHYINEEQYKELVEALPE